MVGKLLDMKLCVRCGKPFSYVEPARRGNKLYLYCVHESWNGGVRKRIKHYCGPADVYDYCSRLHGDIGLTLKAPLDHNRWIEYIINIVETMVDRALEEPRNRPLKDRVTQGLLKIRQVVERSLLELGVEVSQLKEPTVRVSVDINHVDIMLPNGRRWVLDRESVVELCSNSLLHPRLCTTANLTPEVA
jgi:hypothetical protein